MGHGRPGHGAKKAELAEAGHVGAVGGFDPRLQPATGDEAGGPMADDEAAGTPAETATDGAAALADQGYGAPS
ncbi:MAG: hypothetical protein ACXWU1_14635, partial [Allosphingosinicella sp.]